MSRELTPFIMCRQLNRTRQFTPRLKIVGFLAVLFVKVAKDPVQVLLGLLSITFVFTTLRLYIRAKR